MKNCRKCKLEKSLDCFSKSSFRPDGLKDWCKLCQKEESRSRLLKNGGKPRDTDRSKETKDLKICTNCNLLKDRKSFGTSSHCPKCRTLYNNQKYHNGNLKFIPTVTENSKQCCSCKEVKLLFEYSNSKRGRKGKSAYCKSCETERRKNISSETKRNYTQKYRDDNREYWRSLHRINQFNRRKEIKLFSDGTVNKEFISSVLKIEICRYCNNYIEYKNRSIEHILPLNKGGLHTSSNITMSCSSCNSSKKDKTEEEFKLWKSKKSVQQ